MNVFVSRLRVDNVDSLKSRLVVRTGEERGPQFSAACRTLRISLSIVGDQYAAPRQTSFNLPRNAPAPGNGILVEPDRYALRAQCRSERLGTGLMLPGVTEETIPRG